VVADGSKAIRNAVEALWPDAIFYPCEEHLRKNALDAARDDGALGEPGVEQALKQALDDHVDGHVMRSRRCVALDRRRGGALGQDEFPTVYASQGTVRVRHSQPASWAQPRA